MMSVVIRILLRYGAGILVTRGLIGSDDAAAFSSDPDIQMALETGLGLAMAGASEAWYWAAHRFGWAK